jgi:hypothetical protein
MSITPDSSHNTGQNQSNGVPNLFEFSFRLLRSDFFQPPQSYLPNSALILKSSRSVDEIKSEMDELQKFHISLPEFELVSSTAVESGATGTSVLITVPHGLHGESRFNPSYLRAGIGRQLEESELTTISLVTRSIAREILKILDVESFQGEVPGGSQGKILGITGPRISPRLQDFLVSVPHFDPIKHEMVCSASYIGFARNRSSDSSVLREKTAVNSSDAVLVALRELFVDAICTLYSSNESKPIRWAQIAADPGVYAVMDGITSACNEHTLLDYSSQVCGFTNQESLLLLIQSELEERWKKFKFLDNSHSEER